MRHIPFALLAALYVVIIGQNWAVYTAAVAVAAYLQNGGHLTEPIQSVRLHP